MINILIKLQENLKKKQLSKIVIFIKKLLKKKKIMKMKKMILKRKKILKKV